MEDHAKNVEDDSVLGLGDEDEDDEDSEPAPVDEFFADDDEEEQTDPSPAQATDSETLSLIHISEPTSPERISYAVFCLKK